MDAHIEASVPVRLRGVSGGSRGRWSSGGLHLDGANLLGMCSLNTEFITATETADALALIDQGADVHTPRPVLHRLPLHFALSQWSCRGGQCAAGEGCGPVRQDHSRNTSLRNACKYGNAEVVKELLEKGADVHAKNNDGNTRHKLLSFQVCVEDFPPGKGSSSKQNFIEEKERCFRGSWPCWHVFWMNMVQSCWIAKILVILFCIAVTIY